jgi:hypothetical protein
VRIEKPNSFDTKLCRISAALRQGSDCDSHFVGFLVVRNEHHRRDASLDSIDIQFPKLASTISVAGFVYSNQSLTRQRVIPFAIELVRFKLAVVFDKV